jgi:hypothetical protein
MLMASAWAEELPPQISVRPTPVYVERTATGQSVNSDFIIDNRSVETWTLRAIEVSVYDAAGVLALRKVINDNGNSPGIETLNARNVRAGQRILIFNPLFNFASEIPLAVLVYRFDWVSQPSARELSTAVRVEPDTYAPKTPLTLPLGGRIIIWDGHDYYAHHRRFNYLTPQAQADGTSSNADRYGYDLVRVNEAGEMSAGDPNVNSNWFGFGQPVYAAGKGTVVAVFDDGLDNREVDLARFEKDRLADYGNYILIDHGGGEFALYGHLGHGSARVKTGMLVNRGQQIAAVGASGSSLMPHLHFQLQTAARADAEGLPSYFYRFLRIAGARSLTVAHGPIDSGDIVQDFSRRK